MTWKIITRHDCPWCVKAKALLALEGIFPEEELLDTPEKIDAFKQKGFATVPQVFNGDTLIGGYEDTARYINGD